MKSSSNVKQKVSIKPKRESITKKSSKRLSTSSIPKLKTNLKTNNALNSQDSEKTQTEKSIGTIVKTKSKRFSVQLLEKPRFNSGIIVPGRKSMFIKKKKRVKKKKIKSGEEFDDSNPLNDLENITESQKKVTPFNQGTDIKYQGSLKDVNCKLLSKFKTNNSLDNLYKRPSCPSKLKFQGRVKDSSLESENSMERKLRLEKLAVKKTEKYFDFNNRLYEKLHFNGREFDNGSPVKKTYRLTHNYSTDDCSQMIRDPNQISYHKLYANNPYITVNGTKIKGIKSPSSSLLNSAKGILKFNDFKRKQYLTFYERARSLERKERNKLEQLILENQKKDVLKGGKGDKREKNKEKTNENQNKSLKSTKKICFGRRPYISVTAEKYESNLRRNKIPKISKKKYKNQFDFNKEPQAWKRKINLKSVIDFNNEKDFDCLRRMMSKNGSDGGDGGDDGVSKEKEGNIKLKFFFNFEGNVYNNGEKKQNKMLNQFLNSNPNRAIQNQNSTRIRNDSNRLTLSNPYLYKNSRNKEDFESDMNKRMRNAQYYHNLFQTENQKCYFKKEESICIDKAEKEMEKSSEKNGGKKSELSLEPTSPSNSSSHYKMPKYNLYDIKRSSNFSSSVSNNPADKRWAKNSFLDTISYDLMLNNINDKLKLFSTIKSMRNNMNKSLGISCGDEGGLIKSHNKNTFSPNKSKSTKLSSETNNLGNILYSNFIVANNTKIRKNVRIFEEINQKISGLNQSSNKSSTNFNVNNSIQRKNVQ